MYLFVHRDRNCTVKDISKDFNISHHHMVKVVHNLARLGYIESTKGKKGGIRLAMLPEEIRLQKLVLELEPNFNLVECFNMERNTCHIVFICGLKSILHEALTAFLETLGKYTLADAMINPAAFANTPIITNIRNQ